MKSNSNSKSSDLSDNTDSSNPIETKSSLSVKHQVGDAANSWLARNRSLVLRQTPVWAQSLAILMISLGSLSVLGGIFIRIDEVVTVQGQLKSIGGTVEVETPAGGRVAEVYFEDGESVEKGQLLVQFDTREAEERKLTLTRLIELQKDELQTQLKNIASQSVSIENREKVINKRLTTKKAITKEMSYLVTEGGFQRIQYLEQLDQLFELERQITDLQEQKARLSLQADQIKLNSIKSIDQMTNQLKQAELQLQYQNVLSPASGVVFNPAVRVEGVLQPGERILSVVPQNGLYAEVFISNKDIGYVKKGQPAKVRVDAFPFTRYGEINAQVTQISADALPPDSAFNSYRFPLKLSLNQSYLTTDGTQIPLKPGMSVTSNLKLRDKRVISLVSDLLVDQTDSIRSIRLQ